MSTNGFRDEELIARRMKVGNEWQTRVFPVVGGRLRLAHEQNDNLSLQTELVNWDGQYAVFKCRAVTVKGEYVGYGTATPKETPVLLKVSSNLLRLVPLHEHCALQATAWNSPLRKK